MRPTFCYHPRRVRVLPALSIVACLSGCGKLLGLGDPKAADPDGGGSGDDAGPQIDSSPPCVNPAMFAPEEAYAIGAMGRSLAIGRFDRVTGRDVAIAVGDGVQLMLGDNAGMFTAGTKIPAPSGIAVDRVVVGDFSNDGFDDLVVWGAGGTDIAEIRQSVSGGVSSYLAPQALTGPFTGLQEVLSGYLDGAVLVSDLLVKDSGVARTYTSSLGTPGTFLRDPNAVPGVVGNDTLVAVDDLNGTGNDDAVFVTGAGELKVVFDAPAFAMSKMVGSGISERWVGIGQLGGDATPDLIAGTADGGVIYQGGAGGFTQVPGVIASVTGPTMQVIDMNGDGKDDLVVAGRIVYQCAPAVAGDPGVFSQFDAIDGPAVAADVTGDGKPDLLRIAGGELRVRVQR